METKTARSRGKGVIFRKEELRKKFKWKKMNFTTDLPKNDPLCSYLVATGRVGRECFRMHVVVNSQGRPIHFF